jgi:DNA processing protein
LISELGACLSYLAPDRERLIATLSLADGELIEALGGRRRSDLRERYAAFYPATGDHQPDTAALCRHDKRYPRALSSPAAPHMLHLAGAVERLERLTSAPVVAMLGCTKPSDYGVETARGLARGLAASGVTVVSTTATPISSAAQLGALEGGGGLSVYGDGLEAVSRGPHRALLARMAKVGCATSELPPRSKGRRWGAAASERIVVELAQLVVVVEAGARPHELAAAHLARTLGCDLAAVPGRISSPLSAGPHGLLRDGARLIRDTEDLLELLSGARINDLPRARPAASSDSLDPTLRAILERVGAGEDTPDKLADSSTDIDGLRLALSELELLGLLTRGENGRYLPVAGAPLHG